MLEIHGHPIRQAFEAIKAAMPSYTVVQTEESLGAKAEITIAQKGLDGVRQHGQTYHPDERSMLRTDMTWQTLAAVRGMTPPIRLLVPGRVFNAKGWPGGLRPEDWARVRLGMYRARTHHRGCQGCH